jgi:hypothetical protein
MDLIGNREFPERRRVNEGFGANAADANANFAVADAAAVDVTLAAAT